MRRSLAVWLACVLAAAPVCAEFHSRIPAGLATAAPLLEAGPQEKAPVLNDLFDKSPAAALPELPMSFLEARDTLGALSRKAGLKRAPDLRLDRREPENAAAEVDRLTGAASLSVGPVLLANSSRREMTAILAHELGHIAGKARRLILGLVAPTLAAFGLPLAAWTLWGPGASLPYVAGISGIAAAWTAYARYSSYAAREEFAADAFAVRLTKDPEALAGVLEKWGESDPLAPARVARLRAKTSK